MLVIGLNSVAGPPLDYDERRPDVFDGAAAIAQSLLADQLAHDVDTLTTINDDVKESRNAITHRLVPYIFDAPADRLAIELEFPGFVDIRRLCRLAGRRGCLSMPKTPPYSKEFRAEAVRLLRSSGRPIPQLARELGCSEQSLRNWSRQLEVDDGEAEGLTTASVRSCVGCGARI